MENLRQKVLLTFKRLHRARLDVFNGDQRALNAARLRINEEFKKNRAVADVEAIRAMVKFGKEIETELRTQVIQAKEVEPGVYKARITKDTVKLDNVPFDENAELPKRHRKNQACCQDQQQNK